MAILTELFLLIPLSDIFQGHLNVKMVPLKIVSSHPIILKFCIIVNYVD